MENFKIITQASPWFILLALAAGLAYAWLLYSRKNQWSPTINKTLFATRFTTVFIICLLLTGPLMKMVKNYFEKPVLVLAIDNSQSIKYGEDSLNLEKIKKDLAVLTKELSGKELDIDIQTLEGPADKAIIDNLRFSGKTTNLNKMITGIQGNFENRNLTGVILLSDGLFNEGSDPLYENFNFPIYSIGAGDTTEKKDINLKNLSYNKIAYSGNQFPIKAEIVNKGFANQTVVVNLKQGNKVIDKKTIQFKNNSLAEADFLVTAESQGLQHYVVETEGLKGEYTFQNNTAHAYVDVIKGKERILILALAPHPDIKAYKSALESKQNYEVMLHIPGINKLEEGKYDLVVFHQLPDLTNTFPNLTEKYLNQANAYFFIAGNQTNIPKLNQSNSVLSIQPRGNQRDIVTSSYNKNFQKFTVDQEEINTINGYPPVSVPFGTYGLKGDAEVLLYQKIGNVVSDNPLLTFGMREGKKTAVFAGEGFWQWRLDEHRRNGNAKVFDRFFASLTQLLSSKEDKRKFRLYPISNEFSESEKVVFEAEIYNDVYEKVYDKKISLNIKDEEGKAKQYSFTNSEGNSRFEVRGLKPGLYKYTGSVNTGKETHTASGEFVIKEVMLEALNTTANHSLLRELSGKTDGKFFKANQVSELTELLKKTDKPAIIHSNEEFQEFINLPWILALILILISIEWGVRKYQGGY